MEIKKILDDTIRKYIVKFGRDITYGKAADIYLETITEFEEIDEEYDGTKEMEKLANLMSVLDSTWKDND